MSETSSSFSSSLSAAASSSSSSSDGPSLRSILLKEIYLHLDIAWPVIVTSFLRKSSDIVSVIAIGHLGSRYLSAAGIASVTANVTGNSMIWGLSGAISTICSQAIGLKDYRTLSITLQKAILILMICICIPVSILWMFSYPIMHVLGQEIELAYDASLYLQYTIPSLWALSWCASIQMWLHSQSRTRAIAVITLITAVLHPVWCYLLVYYFQIGYLGAAISVSITKTTELILLLCYLLGSNVLKENQFSINISESLQDWWSFLRLGLPSLLLMLEWWASEVIIFMSGSLSGPEDQVSAMSIYQNIISLCFMVPQGFYVSGSTRVGNSLGENHPKTASLAAKVSLLLAIILAGIVAIVLGGLHSYIGYIFTSDPHVLFILAKILPILLLYTVADGAQTALTGVMIGVGKQKLGGPVVIFSYYIIGLPISICLAFSWGANMGIVGLCLGTMIGTWLHFIFFAIIVSQTNWSKEAELIQIRQRFTNKSVSTRSSSRVDGMNRTALSTDEDKDSNDQNKYIDNDSDSDDLGEWWEEIDFLGGLNNNNYNNSNNGGGGGGSGSGENSNSNNNSDSRFNRRPVIQSMHDVGVVVYNRIARRFGWKEMLSEYEMVKNYTDTILDDVVVI